MNLTNPSASFQLVKGQVLLSARYLVAVPKSAGEFAEQACLRKVNYFVSDAEVKVTFSKGTEVAELAFAEFKAVPLAPLAIKIQTPTWAFGKKGELEFLDSKLQMPMPSGCDGKNLGFAKVSEDGLAKMYAPVFEKEDAYFGFVGGSSGTVNVGRLRRATNFVNTMYLQFKNSMGTVVSAPAWNAVGAARVTSGSSASSVEKVGRWSSQKAPISAFPSDFLADLWENAEPEIIEIPEIVAEVTPTPTPVPVTLVQNTPISGNVTCAIANAALVGRPGDNFTFGCDGAWDPDGLSDILYQVATIEGPCPAFVPVNTPKGGFDKFNPVRGDFTGTFGSVGTCAFTIKACDIAGTCTAASATYKLASYSALASLASPTLATNCNLNFLGTTDFSSNVTNATYTGSSGLTNTVVSAAGLSVVLNELDHAAGTYSPAWGVSAANIAGLSNSGSVFAAASAANFTLAFSNPASFGLRTAESTLLNSTTTGRQSPGFVGVNSCLIKGAGVYAMVVTGNAHSCALAANGGVKCWGRNDYGQLGDRSSTNRSSPTEVTGLTTGVAIVAVGDTHSCAITTGGAVKCWGRNNFGQLGDGSVVDKNEPTNVPSLTSGIVAVAAGASHTCALTTAGGVKCWGYNNYGQLGDSSNVDRSSPVDVTGLASGVVAIAAGGSHTCALTAAGGVKCWGYNSFGQLGDASNTNKNLPANVSELSSGIVSIAAGASHMCALAAGGASVKCWGLNGNGQLGDSTTANKNAPSIVTNLTSGTVAIAAGSSHTCALSNVGAAKCWGLNTQGQLGDGTTSNKSAPVTASGVASAIFSIAAGDTYSCGLAADDSGVKCWGSNFYGQLGDGTTTSRKLPTDVNGLTAGVASIIAGDSHSCALTSGGGVRCWGDNTFGQLGDGSSTARNSVIDVTGLASGVNSIAAGDFHTCALTTQGAAKCWGSNGSGQLGDSSITNKSVPSDVTGLASGTTALVAGDFHTCALTSTGGVKCWGYNNYGQLGDSSNVSRLLPVAVSGFETSGATAVAAGDYHTCALTAGGGVKCWGYNNNGQLGDSSTSNRNTPTNVTGLSSGVVGISAGGAQTCARLSDGSAKCWGYNNYGQLGDSTNANKNSPTNVTGLTSGVLAIEVGYRHACVIVTGGGVKCWGYNISGQLGDGTTTNRSSPTNVSGLTSGVGALAVGDNHTCAVTAAGGAKCWGAGQNGQLGYLWMVSTLGISAIGLTEKIFSLP